MAQVHPTASVSTEAVLADDVIIGPFAVIDGPVTIGPGCRIAAHVHLIGPMTIGKNNKLHSGCVLGDEPQHLGYKGEPTSVTIGDDNTFREGVTIHRGMPVGLGRGTTVIGSRNFFMANSHIAHDCVVGDQCILVNGAVVGGHAEIADRAILSGNSGVHQFCRVGTMAFLGGTTALTQDLPPFWMVQGGTNVVRGVNIIGMRRGGYPSEEIQAIRHAFKLLNRQGYTVPAAVETLEKEYPTFQSVKTFIDFVRTTKRGITIGSLGEPTS